MIVICESITVQTSAASAWLLIADYANDAEWRTGVISMASNPVGLVSVGAETREELRFAGKSWRNDGVVTAVETGWHFSWKTVTGADAMGSRTVTPINDLSCRIDLKLCVTPHGSERLMAPLLGWMLRRNLRRDLTQLAVLLSPPAEAKSGNASPAHAV